MKQIRNSDVLFLEDLLIEMEKRHKKEIEYEDIYETHDERVEYARARAEKEKRLKSIILRLRFPAGVYD